MYMKKFNKIIAATLGSVMLSGAVIVSATTQGNNNGELPIVQQINAEEKDFYDLTLEEKLAYLKESENKYLEELIKELEETTDEEERRWLQEDIENLKADIENLVNLSEQELDEYYRFNYGSGPFMLVEYSDEEIEEYNKLDTEGKRNQLLKWEQEYLEDLMKELEEAIDEEERRLIQEDIDYSRELIEYIKGMSEDELNNYFS